jgi:CBS domain-containing protein
MRVLGIMHRGVTSVAPETSVTALARTMRDMDIGALPVVQDDQILGIITDRDVAVRAVADGRDVMEVIATAKRPCGVNTRYSLGACM